MEGVVKRLGRNGAHPQAHLGVTQPLQRQQALRPLTMYLHGVGQGPFFFLKIQPLLILGTWGKAASGLYSYLPRDLPHDPLQLA